MLFCREDAQGDEEAEEAAPPCSVCADGAGEGAPHSRGGPQPIRQAAHWEETAACPAPSKHKPCGMTQTADLTLHIKTLGSQDI